MDGYVSKPISRKDLEEAVRRHAFPVGTGDLASSGDAEVSDDAKAPVHAA
jgi:hypothetical protein